MAAQMNVTPNAITVHGDGTVSYHSGGPVLRQTTIPGTVWLALTAQERERVACRLYSSGHALTVTRRGDSIIGHAKHCGLSAKQAVLLMRASRAKLRAGVAA
jgi:hypothetical protein